MRFQSSFVLILLTAVLHPAQAQDAVEAGSPTPSRPTPAVSAPFVGRTLAFSSELGRSNYVDAGITVGGTFDDNVLNSPSDPKSDIGYSVLPNISLRESLGRLKWKLNYFGGFAVHQRFSAYNQGSHDFGLETSYELAEHVDLLVRDHFLMTTGFFDRLNQTPDTSTGSILQQSNQSVITPLANQVSNTATVAINDQFSASSAIGGSGTLFLSHYKDAPIGTTLIDTNSQEAEAYYNRRISARHSVGVTYRFQRLTFSPLANDTTAHSILATYSVRLQPNMTLSLFAGPQHVETTTQWFSASIVLPQIQVVAVPVGRQYWTGAGGATYAWNGPHTGVAADVIRGISDGGGLLGAVTLTSADVAFRRQVSRRFTAAFGFIYGLNEAIGAVITPYSSLKTGTGTVSVTRQLRDNFGFTIGYGRDYQLEGNAGTGVPNINHNRAWVSVSYQLSRPLGR